MEREDEWEDTKVSESAHTAFKADEKRGRDWKRRRTGKEGTGRSRLRGGTQAQRTGWVLKSR